MKGRLFTKGDRKIVLGRNVATAENGCDSSFGLARRAGPWNRADPKQAAGDGDGSFSRLNQHAPLERDENH